MLRNYIKSRFRRSFAKKLARRLFLFEKGERGGRKAGRREREERKSFAEFLQPAHINGKSSFVVIKVITKLSLVRGRRRTSGEGSLSSLSHVSYVRDLTPLQLCRRTA